MKQNTLAGALLIGVIVCLWYVSSVVGDLNTWTAWDQPAEVAKLLKAGVFGLIAFAAAIGINVRAFLSGLGIPLGPLDRRDAPATTAEPAPPIVAKQP